MNQSLNPDPVSVPTPSSQSDELARTSAELARRARNGSKNFYWIAGLSVVNSLITAFGGNMYLVVGMAATLFVDYFALGIGQQAPELAVFFKIVAIVISLIASGVMALFGFLAGKGARWAYITGLVLYGVDSLIMLGLAEWMGLLFHLLFIWGIFSGLQALSKLMKIVPMKPKPSSDFPQNIGVS